ncbi:MAG: AAC(3) family N-acetyltransferase [Candidatus Puniceispirillales bacterium WSBS_2018_MAG_OTU23]
MEAINWLKNRWIESGVMSGDVLLLHSNIMRTLILLKREGFRPSVDLVLESFLETIGKQGTLVLPLFNFDFTTGVTFDVRSTKSHMGALTEAARKHKDSVRTGHPIYSFCVIGAQSSEFEGIDNYSGYGSDSPFAKVLTLDGKIAVLDIEENGSMTFHHHVEEMKSVPYRYAKDFTGEYVDADGNSSQKTYSIYVRDSDSKVETSVNPMGERLWKKNIYKGFKPNYEAGLRVGNAREIFEYVSDVIDCGEAEGNLFIYGEKE